MNHFWQDVGGWYNCTRCHNRADAPGIANECPGAQIDPVPSQPIKVWVRPRVTTGLERGGEDLEFEIRVELPRLDWPLPIPGPDTEFEVVFSFDICGGGYSVAETKTMECSPRYQIKTCFYDFEWGGFPKDVLDMENIVGTKVRDMLQDPLMWAFCHRPGEPERLRFSHKIFIDGNAE